MKNHLLGTKIEDVDIRKALLISLFLALMATSLTGLIPNTPGASVAEADYHGHPWYWRESNKITGETRISVSNFILDYAFFALILSLISIAFLLVDIDASSPLPFMVLLTSISVVGKYLGELIHEVGHGLPVILFGGSITGVHVSLLWPYEFSSIHWSGSFEAGEMVWIHAGGILACLAVFGLLQITLLLKEIRDWKLSSSIFWVSFWTFLNSTGYLIIGGFRPYGDISDLIGDGVLTQEVSMVTGLILFAMGFLALSRTFIGTLSIAGFRMDERRMRSCIVFLWLIIPLITMIALLGRGWPLFYLPVSFVPASVAYLIPRRFTTSYQVKKIQ